MSILRTTLCVSAVALAAGQAPLAAAQSAAERAVEAAQQYAGSTITITYEAGLQALDPLNFSGPMWEELTGIESRVIEIPINELFTKDRSANIRAHRGASDLLNCRAPPGCPTLDRAGCSNRSTPSDEYGYRRERATSRGLPRRTRAPMTGKIYGLPGHGAPVPALLTAGFSRAPCAFE